MEPSSSCTIVHSTRPGVRIPMIGGPASPIHQSCLLDQHLLSIGIDPASKMAGMKFVGLRTLSLALLICGGAAAQARTKTEANGLANAVILIIRHAEKPETGPELTPIGQKRADAYVGFFKKYRVDGKPLVLDHLFAAKDSKASMRPRLTIEPLAKALNAQIDLRFTDKNPTDIVAELMTKSYGHEILLCWRHGKIPDLIQTFGGDPKAFVPEGKWPSEVYDRVVELHFDAQGKLQPKKSRLVKEHLLPTDEK